jgi:hypothetical protein
MEERCPICGELELHIHMHYETDEELAEYLEFCGTEEVDYQTGKTKKVIYTKVPPGQGTDSQFSHLLGPLLDVLCSEDFHPEELENNGDAS